MAPIPLFTQSDLEAAFGLILPPDVAGRTAARWFSEFGPGNLNADGYYLWDGSAAGDGDTPGRDSLSALITTDPGLSEADRLKAEREFWGGLSVRERVELLLRFTALHFSLLALVSDDLFERMREARGLTPEQAERNREQMRRAVDAVSRS